MTTPARPKRVIFHVGGPAFHPVAEQSRVIASWLGEGYACTADDGLDAFASLDDCDLLVLMGLHWTGMESREKMTYRPMRDEHKSAFERYVASGQPLLAHHGAVASYDDWPRFGELIGVTWLWGTATHSPFGEHTVRITESDHPVVRGVADFQVQDELYYNLKLTPGLPARVPAVARWDGADRPMVIAATGGRTGGAGKMVYLANGHDLRAFEAPAMRTMWINSVRWLLEG